MIKLIAIDLDGTLLTTDKKIPKENLEALHYAHEKGAKIVICTGRPYLAMKDLVEEIGLNGPDDYIIVFNGAQVRKAANGEILISNDLSLDDLNKWYEALTALDLPLDVIDNEWIYQPLAYPEGYPAFYTTKISSAPSKRVDFADFEPGHRFNKFVVTVEAEHLLEQLPKLPAELKENYSNALSHPFQLEVMAKGTGKGEAVAALSEELGIPLSEVMTIGDQENDRSMLTLPANTVAMGNASDQLKAVASYVTDTNDNNGVAKAIYHFLK